MVSYNIEKLNNNFKSLVAIDNQRILGYSKGTICLFDITKKKIKKIVKLPQSFFLRVCSNIRILERILRLEPRFAIKLDNDKYLISYHGGMYKVSLSKKKIVLEHKFSKGMNNPLNACKVQGLEGFEDGIYYGEYTGNSDKSEVFIYKRNLNDGVWKFGYSFKKGQINHIHNIIPDYKNQRMLILTGDSDSASGIWSAKENFSCVVPLLIGKQKFRSCSLFPVGQGFVYATDTPLEKNYIFYTTLVEGVWKSNKICEIDGSVIYSIENNGIFYFSTTVEPDSRIKGKRGLFTNKIGPGIKDRDVRIIAGNIGEGFKIIAKYRKDIFPMALCQFGAVHFSNFKKNQIILHPIAVDDVDNNLIIFKRSE